MPNRKLEQVTTTLTDSTHKTNSFERVYKSFITEKKKKKIQLYLYLSLLPLTLKNKK